MVFEDLDEPYIPNTKLNNFLHENVLAKDVVEN